MRISKILFTGALLLPAGVFAASKEQQEMQRDIAQLQDQVRALQSSQDQRLAAIQVLVQQALDAGNKANTGVSVLTANVSNTLERDVKQALVPVSALAAKVDNTNNDMAEVRNQVAELTTQVNKIYALLNDLNNAVKLIQAPAAAPPPTAGGPPNGASMGVPGSPAGGPAAGAPPAAALFANAVRDYNGGNMALSLQEYSDFLKFYPDDPNAASAQYNIGEIHYLQNKLEVASKDFDAVIERYGDNAKVTPDAYFMKGMALKQSARKADSAATFRALIAKFPRSDRAKEAKEQLTAMGMTSAAAPAAARKRR